MYLLAAFTVAVFAVGYWSATTRLAQLGVKSLPTQTKAILALLCLGLVLAAPVLLLSDSVAVLFGEFLILCVGQIFGYIFYGRVS